MVTIFGAGGHAKVVYDALVKQGVKSIYVVDDNPVLQGESFLDTNIYSRQAVGKPMQPHVAIGSNLTRKKISEVLREQQLDMFTIVHPSSIVSEYAVIGAGSFLAAKSIIAPDAVVGEGCIINHSAIVDHDCSVGSFTHIAPGAILGGNVIVGTNVIIGAGAKVLPGVEIADNCIVGAGAVVLNNIVESQTVVGVPAMPKKHD